MNIIVMDPCWNPSCIQQIIGRGIRFNSHIGLPKDKRHVNVYFLLFIKPRNQEGPPTQ